jgi:REP element-mobilizing transposase RayT
MPQSFVCLNDHLIFSTKQREPTLPDGLRPRLFEYIGGYLDAEKACLLAAGGMTDHVHLLVSLHQQTSVADALRGIKANSSKWIHEMFPALSSFAWQTGYGAFTVSYSRISRVKRYIEDQTEHHRVRSFQDEFRSFLRRHGVSFDERYLWD